MSETLETEMWSKVDLNPRPLFRLFIAKLPANLAGYSELIKAAELQRALSPRIRPQRIPLWSQPAVLFLASMTESPFNRYKQTVELQRRALRAWPTVTLAWRILFPSILILTFLFLWFRFASM